MVRGARVTLRHLTIEGGEHAGIRDDGVLTVVGSTVRDNGIGIAGKGDIAGRGDGGGISISDGTGLATLTLIRSVVRDNTGRGGAIDIGISSAASASLVDSHVTGNTAGLEGGGIWASRSSVTLDAASSVTGNTPDDCVGTPAC